MVSRMFVARIVALMLFGLLVTVTGTDSVHAADAYVSATDSYVSFVELTNAGPLSDEAFTALAERVQQLDTTFNVQARAEYGVYLEFGEALIRQGDYEQALEMYLRGLRLNAFDIDAQLRAAELEIYLDRRERALQRLHFVLDHSENERQVKHATNLMAQNPFKGDGATLVMPSRYDLILRVVPIGQFATLFAEAVKSRLQQEFRITVEVALPVAMPTNIRTRNTLVSMAEETVIAVEENNPEEVIRGFYQNLGLSPQGPTTDSEKLHVLWGLLMLREDGASVWEQLNQDAYDQYNGVDILDFAIKYADIATSRSKYVGVLAITEEDIYRDGVNFVFALSTQGAAVISIYSFYQLERGHTLSEGLHRTVVQAMTSYVQILGLPRATGHCATAYANSLEEFDRKPDVLCQETIERLITYYGQR